MSSTQPSFHQYQQLLADRISPTYLSAFYCATCRRPGHVTRSCLPRHRRSKKSQAERITPSQSSHDISQTPQASPQNSATTPQPSSGATLYYYDIYPSLASAPTGFYSNTSFYGSTQAHDVQDLDFPSLSVKSLDDCLLNSPLEVDSAAPTPSDTTTPHSSDVSQIFPEECMNHNPEAYEIMSTPSDPTLATTGGKGMYAKPLPSVEMSHFDEATWNDECNYLFTPSENA
jgi:hypothetical protein